MACPSYTGPAAGPRSQRAGLEGDGADESRGGYQVIMKFNCPGCHPTAPRHPQQSEICSIKRGEPQPLGGTLPTGTTIAHEYVWHCHILEHEEHDMMRPLIVAE